MAREVWKDSPGQHGEHCKDPTGAPEKVLRGMQRSRRSGSPGPGPAPAKARQCVEDRAELWSMEGQRGQNPDHSQREEEQEVGEDGQAGVES